MTSHSTTYFGDCIFSIFFSCSLLTCEAVDHKYWYTQPNWKPPSRKHAQQMPQMTPSRLFNTTVCIDKRLRNKNTSGNVSKISVNHRCHHQICRKHARLGDSKLPPAVGDSLPPIMHYVVFQFGHKEPPFDSYWNWVWKFLKGKLAIWTLRESGYTRTRQVNHANTSSARFLFFYKFKYFASAGSVKFAPVFGSLWRHNPSAQLSSTSWNPVLWQKETSDRTSLVIAFLRYTSGRKLWSCAVVSWRIWGERKVHWGLPILFWLFLV